MRWRNASRIAQPVRQTNFLVALEYTLRALSLHSQRLQLCLHGVHMLHKSDASTSRHAKTFPPVERDSLGQVNLVGIARASQRFFIEEYVQSALVVHVQKVVAGPPLHHRPRRGCVAQKHRAPAHRQHDGAG
jgi:hypothetical protein